MNTADTVPLLYTENNLGTGDLSKALTVEAHAISSSAKSKIEKAGGSVKIIE